MSMTSKQMYRRLNECYESEYGDHDWEAEWYGTDDEHIWLFYIPSNMITVKLELNEKAKRVDIMERKDGAETEFRRVGNWSWR